MTGLPPDIIAPTGIVDRAVNQFPRRLQVISPDYRYLYFCDVAVLQSRASRAQLLSRTMEAAGAHAPEVTAAFRRMAGGLAYQQLLLPPEGVDR